MSEQVYPCIWLKKDAKKIAEFYCSIFKEARILSENPFVVLIHLNGQKLMFLNGSDSISPNESFSLVVTCKDQNEIDYYWNNLSQNGTEGKCGWLKDQFGISWQIVPDFLGELMNDPEKAPKAMYAFMQMSKIEIDKLIEL